MKNFTPDNLQIYLFTSPKGEHKKSKIWKSFANKGANLKFETSIDHIKKLEVSLLEKPKEKVHLVKWNKAHTL